MVNQKTSIFKNKNFWVGAASFMLPAIVLYVIYAFFGVHPFGDKQIIVTDFWHQYYPFLCEFSEKLKAGESLFYAEDIGLGLNFWALIAYYCASPLNLLTALVPKEGLRDLLTIIVTVKVGFAGLFFSRYIKKVFDRYDFSVVAFSSLYALCGYVLGYYWNIMWLDCVSLLPLVMLGVYLIIKENKYILYTVSLAICVISNFYIGFMVCIFTAIYFFCESIRVKVNFKSFLKSFITIAVCSVVALSITAFMTIPAYLALGDTVSSVPKTEKSETIIEKISDGAEEFFKDAPEVIGRTLSFNQPVPKDGLPNIFSGFICVILLGYYLCSKDIKLREKIATSVMIVLLIVSMAVSDIDIIWHGFHKPNMVPYRYAFVFSFVMITMAYKAFLSLETLTKKDRKPAFFVSLAISALTILCAVNDDVKESLKVFFSEGKPVTESLVATILGCAALTIVYYIIISSITSESGKARESWCKVLCYLIVGEVIINTVIAVPTVRVTTYSTYYYKGEEIEKLLEKVDAGSSYGRVDSAQEYILNDPALYGFKGVSTFTSTASYPVTKLMEKLALCAPARSNRYYYQTTSPLTNAFLGVERVVFRNGMKNLNPYLEFEAAEYNEEDKEQAAIYKNTQALPIGFMVDDNFLEEALVESNPFDVQNDLFRKATGLEEDLFTKLDIFSVMSTNTVRVKGSEGNYSLTLDEGETEKKLDVNYVIPEDASVYAYIDGAKINSIKINDTKYKAVKRKYIFPAGKYEKDTKITFKFAFEDSFDKSGNMKFHVYYMDDDLFARGMEMLRDEPFEIENYTSTHIDGKINALTDGVFYTSIPYEKGWSMYVDGEKTQITPFEGAFISVSLDKGEHSISLRYVPYGFKLGAVISIIGVVMLVGLILVDVIRRRKQNG